ncbi:acetoin utilization protein AcuB [Jeotgalicoccus aerolatus]|uniref:Acetoin utilization protein AcuB n=1 Tax=Jeotgalicoccus aerolatus TaxID=709510 RepID=A0A1G9BMF3_9STAP|nr:CBS and ACT domain-containing protein [Jeotgalicoccus aerolatus]SDK40642.1 acetoin utilization protein AcuB [Jeotgalicoccus aerolatus]HJG32248.1 CBS and ACT domain-containing protein [Jeotgalicoccus aerolatus]
MLVERIMTSPVETLHVNDTIHDAMNMMSRLSIRHIPIVGDDGNLAGIISDKDVNLALPSIASSDAELSLDLEVNKIMRQQVTTCHPLDFVEEIAKDFYHFAIGAIPVMRGKKIVGIVTQKDMLNTFLELTGIKEPGSIIEIKIKDRMGVIFEIGKVFKDLNIKIVSISIYPDSDKKDYKIIVLRIDAMNPLIAIEKLKESGFKVLDPSEMS